MPPENEAVGIDHSDAEIASNWKEILSRHSADDPVEAPEKTAAEPAVVDKSTEQETGKARDEQGRFSKPATVESPAADNATTETAAPAAEVTEQAQTRQLDQSIAPSSWKPAAKAKWDAIDPDLRGEILRREEDFLKGQQQLLPDARLGQSMRNVIEPYRMLIESEGGTPERAVQSLLQTAALFRVGTAQQKQQAWMQLGQQYGIQMPGAIGGETSPDGQQQFPQQPFQDPRVDQLLLLQQQEQQRKIAEQEQRTNSVVETWASEVDKQGKPLRPYLANVLDEMQPIVRYLRTTSSKSESEILQEAYDRAVWANPETRAVVQQQMQQKQEVERQQANLVKVQEAKKAASVNTPRRAASPAPAKPGKMEDTIRESARTLGFFS